MAKIKVKDLQENMTLTADVCDPNGRFLLGEGCVLNDKHLKALTAWGVISVEVIDTDVPEDKDRLELSAEISLVIEQQINVRFRHNDMNHPFIKELAKESKHFIVEKLED